MNIYTFIGVNGSGKGSMLYRIKEYNSKKRGFLEFDFSDGVREYTYDILGIVPPETQEKYDEFKKTNIEFIINGKPYSKTGRDFLDSVGERMRRKFPKFWADYTKDKVLNSCKENMDIYLGSCRVEEEAEMVLEVSKELGATPVFIFCDYKSDKYDDRPLEYQKMALYFRSQGCGHGQRITEMVKTYLENERTEKIS